VPAQQPTSFETFVRDGRVTCSVVVGPEAEEQLAALVDWWGENRSGVAPLPVDEFESATYLAASLPGIGSPFPKATLPGVRRLLLKKCKHWLYYVHDPARSVVYVLAVWSAYRGNDPVL
jgi:hypothetical protein